MTTQSSQGRIRPYQAVPEFHHSFDVIVCGLGGAGGAAALEARRAGAEVLVLERASAGGGSTAMSSCEMYLGGSGGTQLQKDLGFEDSTENMVAYLNEALGARGDQEKINQYAQGAAEHFNWVESLGVTFKRAALLERVVVPLSDESLLYTGNEKTYPFNRVATPVPRGHVPSMEGDEGGKLFMEALIGKVMEEGCQIQVDSRVVALLQDDNGAIRGVVAKQAGKEVYIEARSGVVLASGGFVMNNTMTERYLPETRAFGVPYGNTYDQGDGILLGMAAGGNAINMDQAFMAMPVYPPAKLTFGLLVNEQGQRFVNEDAYLARLAHYCSQQSNQKVYLLIQNEDFEQSHYFERLDVVAVGDSIEELEAEANMPDESLQTTVEYYNRFAEQSEDPLFNKDKEWVKQLNKPPFALVSYSFEDITAAIMPGTKGPLIFTLGGLETRPTGEVLSIDGEVIPGLFAAGRVSAGLPRTAKGYASGMSVGDATFFGRKAGKRAALWRK